MSTTSAATMADINIERTHDLGTEQARQTVENVAQEMAGRFDLEYWWEHNVLHFHRRGVNGRMEVEDSMVRVLVRLGLLMQPLKSRISREIESYLKRLLNGA